MLASAVVAVALVPYMPGLKKGLALRWAHQSKAIQTPTAMIMSDTKIAIVSIEGHPRMSLSCIS